MQQAEAQYRLVKEGPRKEEIEQARARVEQAKATLKSAETKLGYAKVTSPLTGVVLSKNIEPGEYVAAGTPVVTVADIENLWLRAYVDETDLGKRNIALGTEAEITTDAYPGKVYPGHVSFISSEQEFTPKSVRDQSRAGEIRLSDQDRREESGRGVETRHAGRCTHRKIGNTKHEILNKRKSTFGERQKNG